MRLQLDATPEELVEKGEALIKALADQVRDANPELAHRLEKAVKREPVLKYKALREMHAQNAAKYQGTLESMVSDIEDVLNNPELSKARAKANTPEWTGPLINTTVDYGVVSNVPDSLGTPASDPGHEVAMALELWESLNETALEKADQLKLPLAPRRSGPFIGPRGGKWADAAHTISWQESQGGAHVLPKTLEVPYEPMAKAEFRKEMDRRRSEGLILQGKTYAYKDLIKQAGGVWDRHDRVWLLPSRDAILWFRQQMRSKAPPPRTDPSARQVDFVTDLIQKTVDAGLWSQTSVGGFDPPTRSEIRQWPSFEVSALIDDLRGMGPQVRRATAQEKAKTDKAVVDDDKGTWNLHAGSGYGSMGWQEGQTLRLSPETRARLKGASEFVTVIFAKSRYYHEDGLSFGVGDDEGYTHFAKVRPATEEEAAPVRERLAAKELRAQHERELVDLRREIDQQGEYPLGSHNLFEGERLFDTQNIYGGGSWVVITPTHIWNVTNNGADGDSWAHNNVLTGGAGAVGRRVPYDEALAARLRELHGVLHGA